MKNNMELEMNGKKYRLKPMVKNLGREDYEFLKKEVVDNDIRQSVSNLILGEIYNLLKDSNNMEKKDREVEDIFTDEYLYKYRGQPYRIRSMIEGFVSGKEAEAREEGRQEVWENIYIKLENLNKKDVSLAEVLGNVELVANKFKLKTDWFRFADIPTIKTKLNR